MNLNEEERCFIARHASIHTIAGMVKISSESRREGFPFQRTDKVAVCTIVGMGI